MQMILQFLPTMVQHYSICYPLRAARQRKWGSGFNTKKTETMSVSEQLDFFIDGHKLKEVERFKCLGSYVTKNCKLDEEITGRIQAASCTMGRLRDRVFSCRGLTVDTKV